MLLDSLPVRPVLDHRVAELFPPKDGPQVPVHPYYQTDIDKKKKRRRVALRVQLGDKHDAKGKKCKAQFYLSTVLGWGYNTTFQDLFDEFVAQGWEGDHLVDLESDDLEAPERALFFLFIWG